MQPWMGRPAWGMLLCPAPLGTPTPGSKCSSYSPLSAHQFRHLALARHTPRSSLRCGQPSHRESVCSIHRHAHVARGGVVDLQGFPDLGHPVQALQRAVHVAGVASILQACAATRALVSCQGFHTRSGGAMIVCSGWAIVRLHSVHSTRQEQYGL